MDAYLVLSADAHLNEYTPEYTRRRTAITGFRGSAGDAIICPQGSHLFVDSRYHLQADDEVDHDNFQVHKLGLHEVKTLSQWLTEMEKERGSIRVGIDPFTVSMQAHEVYKAALKSPDSALVPLDGNLVDAVWDEQPTPPSRPIYRLTDDLTGSGAAEKLENVRKEMEEAGASLLVLTKLDEIAWATNLRGSDIAYNPVFEGYMVIGMESAACYTRVSPPGDALASLAGLVDFRPYEDYSGALKDAAGDGEGAVWLDPTGTTMGTRLMLDEGRKLHEKPNPTVALKAVKNERGDSRFPQLPPPRRRRQDSQFQAAARVHRGGRHGERGRLQPHALRRIRQRGRLLRPEFHHHRRRRPQRRHRPLRRRQPGGFPGTGRDVPGGLGRSTDGRHHRRHPHGDNRRPVPAPERRLYPGAAGPHQPGDAEVPRRHGGHRPGRPGPHLPLERRAGLRPRHGPRGRRLPERPRRAAAHHAQGGGRALQAGDDSFQRAGLLRSGLGRRPPGKPVRGRSRRGNARTSRRAPVAAPGTADPHPLRQGTDSLGPTFRQ